MFGILTQHLQFYVAGQQMRLEEHMGFYVNGSSLYKVCIKTHKTAINRPVDDTGET